MKKLICLFLAIAMVLFSASAFAEEPVEQGFLKVENGVLQPYDITNDNGGYPTEEGEYIELDLFMNRFSLSYRDYEDYSRISYLYQFYFYY